MNKKFLLNNNIDIVGKKKITFGISGAIILAGIIAMIIGLIFTGSILNLGTDFEGGYSMDVKSTNITVSNFDNTLKEIKNIVTNLKDDNGNNYGLKWKGYQKIGDESDLSLHFSYSIVGNETLMKKVSDKLKNEISKKLNIDLEDITDGSKTDAVVSSGLISNAIITVAISLLLMLLYIAIRFEFASGMAAIAGLFHDVLIMISLMAIFRVEINSTFIAALITIVGLSINNIIIVFDRLRETVRNNLQLNSDQCVNKSVNDTIVRSILYSLTSFVTIFMVWLLGVSDIKIFAFPILVGLIAGTYSSIFISPTLWAMRSHKSNKLMQHYSKKKTKKKIINKAEPIV